MTDKIDKLYLRKNILYVIITGFYLVLAYQLYRMQILQGEAYETKSEENSIKRNEINAPRGIFFDRNFKVLVGNTPSFTISVTPAFYEKEYSPYLESILSYNEGTISELLKKKKRAGRYKPLLVSRDANFSAISWIEENKELLPGIEYNVEIKRDYDLRIRGSHIFGYTREITADKLSTRRDEYDIGDFIGYSGLEKTYEKYLRGKKGYRYTVVDSRQRTIGRYMDGTADVKPIKGNDLVLSIDADLQALSEDLMKDKRGAIVAIEPTTGEILSFVSAPDFDLNALSAVTTNSEWSALLSDTSKPLFNRATMAIYAPGSTIKMLEAIVSVEEGIWSPEKTIICNGGWQFGDRFFKCTHVHGRVNMERSIEKSCNTYYYQLIHEIGLERWTKYVGLFGFGHKTGIDIPEETRGILPSREYYNRLLGNNWTDGVLMNLSIGQGEVSCTPVQLAQYAALLANFGKTRVPHLVKGYIDSETNEFVEFEFDSVDIGIKHESFEVARKGMLDVVHGEGTARWIRQKGVNIAGKTGTAQNPFGEDHAIFIAFAPYENPEIAVAVFVENAGFGSTHAAPLAGKVIKKFMDGKNNGDKNNLIMRVDN